jgi:hypothetical protein
MYFLEETGGGELEFTKLGEYDQVNHTAEFILNGEANESIGVRIDYYDQGAAQHFYEVEQPRNRDLVFTVVPLTYMGALGFAIATGRHSLGTGLLHAGFVVVALGALYILAIIGELLSLAGGGY